MRYIQLLYEAAEDVRKAMIVPTVVDDSQISDNEFGISEFERGLGLVDVMEKAKVPVHLRAP